MIISEWLKQACENIQRLDAEVILTHELSMSDRAYLIAHSDQELPADIVKNATEKVKRRETGEPLAIILNEKEFYGRKFWLNDGKVLTPRPESETIIDFAKELPVRSVLDVGTGSGCLAITLALEMPDSNIVAVDLSDDALETVEKNAKKLSAKISLLKSNLLESIDELPDLIVANLPYVDEKWDWLDKNTLNFEPSMALYAEQGGLALIFKLIEQICEKNNNNNVKYLILEADPCQHKQIISFAQKHGFLLQKQQGFILQFSY